MKVLELRIAGKSIVSVGRYCGHLFVWMMGGRSFVVGGTEKFAAKMHLVNSLRAMRVCAIATANVLEGTES
jgi:hypothetical protein